MTNIRRYYIDGCCYFLTNVAYDRRPVMNDNYDLIWKAIERAKEKIEYELIAWVFLPEHFHVMINPVGGNFSEVLKLVKQSFIGRYYERLDIRSGRVWQNRFWDHIIRDEKDFWAHLNYIHLNPVKHGLVKSPFDWPHSSIHKWKEFYQDDWGVAEELDVKGDFGE